MARAIWASPSARATGTRRIRQPFAPPIAAGRVKAVYVVDPGPDGSLGDVSWMSAARRDGALPLLVVQGVVMSELAASSRHRAARSGLGREGRDLHERSGPRAGARRGRLRRRERRMDDWQILANVGRSSGCRCSYQTSSDVRQAIARALPAAYADADKVPFTRPIPARNWLQASNPSERWKWDFLYPGPAAGEGAQRPDGRRAPTFIPLKPVG